MILFNMMKLKYNEIVFFFLFGFLDIFSIQKKKSIYNNVVACHQIKFALLVRKKKQSHNKIIIDKMNADYLMSYEYYHYHQLHIVYMSHVNW